MIRTSDDLSIANDTSTHTLEHQHHVLVSNRTSPQANPRMILLYRIDIDSHPNQTDRKILSDLWVESWDESMTWLQAFSQSRPCMEISDHEVHWPEVRSLHVCRVRMSCTSTSLHYHVLIIDRQTHRTRHDRSEVIRHVRTTFVQWERRHTSWACKIRDEAVLVLSTWTRERVSWVYPQRRCNKSFVFEFSFEFEVISYDCILVLMRRIESASILFVVTRKSKSLWVEQWWLVMTCTFCMNLLLLSSFLVCMHFSYEVWSCVVFEISSQSWCFESWIRDLIFKWFSFEWRKKSKLIEMFAATNTTYELLRRRDGSLSLWRSRTHDL